MNDKLTNADITRLINLEKFYVGNDLFEYPCQGGKLIIPLLSSDKDENFILDIYRATIRLSKNIFQNRARRTFLLFDWI